MNGAENKISIERLAQKFGELWQPDAAAVRFFRAPGRVNIIGEHTDYNDGFVLPIALNYTATVLASPRADDRVEVYSANYDELKTFDFEDAARKKTNEWLNYVEGVARVLRAKDGRIGGANLLIGSDVPVGAGLSSSAAIEIAVGFALTCVNNLELDRVELALAGQTAEHEFVGAKSGIMDQFVAVFGRAAHALLIDCRALKAKAIPLKLDKTEIIVCNSGVKHSLASSEYNTRRAECEKGVEILREYLPEISALRDVSLEDFDKYAAHLPEVIRRRCRFVITENARALRAAEAFEQGDIAAAGKLMSESHAGLRDDYEVSCPELDLLVFLAKNFDGVEGARMTGGGFGGCTINLVRGEKREQFVSYIEKEYERRTGRRTEIFCVEPSDGAAEIKMPDGVSEINSGGTN